MDGQPQTPDDMSEEELRAAYEEQLKQVRVEDVLIQTVVSLLNLGGRKAGLAPGTEDERDPEQLRQAIEGTRALLPLVDATLGPDAKQLRDVLSQLQMAYAQLAPAGSAPVAAEPEKPADPGPGQPSGRIWVPGQ
ncbi:MAG: hypothetical protein JWM73_826 [Solirubrobacterales bacterium]|jgi:hypothetical protein|nr:hypothetical protein [Solirubrobacterales bacterium]